MNPQTAPATTLRLERLVRATRQRVFDAWTKPEILQQWSAPEGLTIPEGELDLRVGGRWRVVMQEIGGTRRYVASGTYHEVTPPERLVYTHSWETDTDPHETLVTIEFHEEGEATRVVLVQEGLPTVESRDGHAEGWGSALDKLVALFA